jgi:hypothetical protein
VHDRVRRRARGVGEPLRPDQREALEQLLLRRFAAAPALLDLLDPRDRLGGEPASQGGVLLREDVGRDAEGAEADEPREPVRMRHRDVHRQVAAPRVADRPRPLDLEEVEDRERVRDVCLDRVRLAGRGGRGAALLVADRPGETVELTDEAPHIVGHGRAAVEHEGGRPLSGDIRLKRPSRDRDSERLLAHRATVVGLDRSDRRDGDAARVGADE